MNQRGYVCQACGEVFPAHVIRPNRRDDCPCPACGSLRLEQATGRLDWLRALPIAYNRA